MLLNVMEAIKGDTEEINWYIQVFVEETKIIPADFFFFFFFLRTRVIIVVGLISWDALYLYIFFILDLNFLIT